MKTITKKQNIRISIIITFFTMIVSLIAHFFYTPFMLNKVGDNQYGLYGFVSSALSWVTVAINAVLAAYNKIIAEEIAKNPDEGEKNINSIYSLIVIIWALIISIISTVFIILLITNTINLSVYSIEDQRTISILFSIVALQTVFIVLTSVVTLNITYNNHHVWIKLVSLAVTTFSPIISIPFLLKGYGIIAVASIQVGLNCVSCILNILFFTFILKKKYPIFPSKQLLKYIKPILLFSSVILINEVAFQLDNSVDNLVLGVKGYSSDITLYSLALSIVTIASTCSTMIYTPFIPTVFSNSASNNKEGNKKIFDSITFCQMVLWLLITGGFISCGKQFVIMWIGEERLVVYYLCSTLFIIKSISNCAGPSRDMMRADNKHFHRAILAVCVTALNIGFTVLFINVLPREKALWGCIIGTAISSFLGWWIAANVLNKIYLKVDIKKFFLSFVFLSLICFISLLPSVLLSSYIFERFINKIYLIFLINGFMFVFIFSGFSFLLFKRRIFEVVHFFRQDDKQ